MQVDLQPLARLSSPLSSAEPWVALQNQGLVMGKRHPELTPVQWRFAKCLTPWEALTCFSFSSSLSLTGARSEFSVLAGPIKSPCTVRFQALFLLILHSSLCDIVPHWAITGTVWDTLNSPSTSVWQYHSCSHLCFSSVTEAALGSPAHFIPTF